MRSHPRERLRTDSPLELLENRMEFPERVEQIRFESRRSGFLEEYVQSVEYAESGEMEGDGLVKGSDRGGG